MVKVEETFKKEVWMKERYLMVLIVGILMPIFGFADSYRIEWTERFGNIQNPNSHDDAEDVIVDNNGNIFITGSLEFDSSSGNYWRYLTLKYDSLGNIVWADTINSSSTWWSYGIALDNDGNIIITGSAFTVKYDPLGNILWIDTLSPGYGYGVNVDKYSNIFTTGSSSTSSDADFITVKYDPNGNILWADTVNVDSIDVGRGIAINKNGRVLITGEARDARATYSNWITICYDSLGNMLWADTINNGTRDAGYGAISDGDNFILTGYSYIGGSGKLLTVKYDPNGNIVWSDTIDNYAWEVGTDIAIDTFSGDFVIGGYVDSPINTCDYFVAKYDSLGNMLWSATLDSGDADFAHGVDMDKNGNIILTGNTGDSYNADWLTVKYDPYHDVKITSIIAPSDTVISGSSLYPEAVVENLTDWSESLYVKCIIGSYLDSVYIILDSFSVDTLTFSQWIVPLQDTATYRMRVISLLYGDDSTYNDTLTKNIFAFDSTPPVIDSAVAYDGTNPGIGIDDDDYVILFFSRKTNTPLINALNIDSVFYLSGRHSWLDGFGIIDTTIWNPEGNKLMICLSTIASVPTISPGDTITPDSSTITSIAGIPCYNTVILKGSFNPSGIKKENTEFRIKNSGFTGLYPNPFLSYLRLTYGLKGKSRVKIDVFDNAGRIVKELKNQEQTRGFYSLYWNGTDNTGKKLPSGIYFIRFEAGKYTDTRKVILIK